MTEQILECIACGGKSLKPLLDLGSQPLANSYLDNAWDVEKTYPLATNVCLDCCHVQLTHKVDPDLLFKNYLYVSGTAKTQLDYFEWFASKFAEYPERMKEYGQASVLDIGCNDGSQLDAFKKIGFETYGVDPAENLHHLSSTNHNVLCKHFDGTEFDDKKFDIIICQNAFAHNYNQLELLKNMGKKLKGAGLIMIATSQSDMIINGEFDTIYHEHLSFYNSQSMYALCKRAGLHLCHITKHPIHGSSYIFAISNDSEIVAPSVNDTINDEITRGLYEPETYEEYVKKCETTKNAFTGFIERMRTLGQKVVGYGAPAKANTFMNWAEIGPDFIVDDNALKQGKYTPGLRIPILSSQTIIDMEDENVAFIPLAWNFYDEIIPKIRALRPSNANDTYFRYFPKIEVTHT